MAKQWKRSLSGADVQAEAEDALEKDISQMSPASNSVAANLDGGVAAVDWSSKTPEFVFEGSISGSGYVTGVAVDTVFDQGDYDVTVDIDGSEIFNTTLSRKDSDEALGNSLSLLYRFESSASVSSTNGNGVIAVVLD